MTKQLEKLINKTCDLYNISSHMRGLALVLDPRALKQIGDTVGSRVCKLSISELYEVTKWGINNSMSQFAELKKVPSRYR